MAALLGEVYYYIRVCLCYDHVDSVVVLGVITYLFFGNCFLIMVEETQQIRRTESGYRFELSGLRTACADAMINMGASQNIDQLNTATNYAVSCLNTLEDHLASYHDPKYREARDGKANKKTGKKEGGFDREEIIDLEGYKKANPNHDPDKVRGDHDNYRLDILRRQLRKKYAALMFLQDRKNLLLEEEADDYAGGNPQ